jgi:hypothetical protein
MALKGAIMDADISGHREEIRLDERQLSRALGVADPRGDVRSGRLPAHRSAPRHLHRQETKKEVIEIIEVCAALENMAARLATINASDESIGALRVVTIYALGLCRFTSTVCDLRAS